MSSTLLLCHKATALPQGHICTSSSSCRLLAYLFLLLASPGPLPEIAVSEFSRCPLGRPNTFPCLLLLLTPLVSLSPFVLALAFPLFLSILLLLSCIPQTSLWTVPLLGFLLHPFIHSRLRYPTLSQLALSSLSPMQPYQLYVAGNLFFGMFLTLYGHFNFVTSLFVSSECISSSPRNTVLLPNRT